MAEYIEREAAIDACFDGWDNNAHDCAENIRLIPAADVRPVVRGEWINYQQERWIYAKCSICETVHDVKSNFCPNCGADMREES